MLQYNFDLLSHSVFQVPTILAIAAWRMGLHRA
jgi:hypothetical protein